MAVYLDMVFFLNFSVDFLLLLGTNRLTGFPSGYLRCMLSALLGGLYAACCLVPGFSFLGNPLWRFVSLGLMGVLAFGCSRSALRRCCVFFLLSMALGGIALSAGNKEFLGLLLCGGVLWGACYMGFGGGIGRQEYRVLKLTLGGKTVSLLALQDTGNSLRDPVSGESVVVISPQAACRLTGLTQSQLRQPVQTLAQGCLPGLRLIPYRSVGGSGLLLGLRIPEGELDGKRKSLLVAFAPEGLGNGDVYQALTGGTL